MQAIRAHGRAGTKVGPAENIVVCIPAIETPANIRAAEIATRELNAGYLTVMLVRSAMGKYDNGNADHIEILGQVTGDGDARTRERGIAADARLTPNAHMAPSGREIATELRCHRDVSAGQSGGPLHLAVQLDRTPGGDHAVRDVAIDQHPAARDHGVAVDRAAQLDG